MQQLAPYMDKVVGGTMLMAYLTTPYLLMSPCDHTFVLCRSCVEAISHSTLLQ